MDPLVVIEGFMCVYSNTKKNNDPGYVYLLECEGHHKIGKARNLLKRISAYKTHNPFDCELVKKVYIEDCSKFEEMIHQRFSCFRHRGEWYKFTDGSLDVIYQIFDKYSNG